MAPNLAVVGILAVFYSLMVWSVRRQWRADWGTAAIEGAVLTLGIGAVAVILGIVFNGVMQWTLGG